MSSRAQEVVVPLTKVTERRRARQARVVENHNVAGVMAQTFANSCEAQAEWLRDLAAEDGDDRHAATEKALREAARWALTAHEAERVLSVAIPLAVSDLYAGLLRLNEQATDILSTFCSFDDLLLDDDLIRGS